MTIRHRKLPKVRLIDDGALAVSRDRSRRQEKKPDAWFRSEMHKAWIRTLPCCAKLSPLHAGRIEAMHVRIGTDGAGSERPSDYFAIPGCERCHRLSHSVGEQTFHRTLTGYRDPAMVALNLALESPCKKTVAAAKEEIERRVG